MTNGDITKKIMKVVNNNDISNEDMAKKVRPLLGQFPLSSHKLVYDQDIQDLPEDRKAALLEVCADSDKEKVERGIEATMADFGASREQAEGMFSLPWGRYTGEAKKAPAKKAAPKKSKRTKHPEPETPKKEVKKMNGDWTVNAGEGDEVVRVTANERIALDIARNYDSREAQLSDNYSNLTGADLIANTGWSPQKAGGVIHSIIKKGLAWQDRTADVGKDIVWLTDKGVHVIFNILDTEKAKQGEKAEPKKETTEEFNARRKAEHAKRAAEQQEQNQLHWEVRKELNTLRTAVDAGPIEQEWCDKLSLTICKAKMIKGSKLHEQLSTVWTSSRCANRELIKLTLGLITGEEFRM